MGSVGNPVLGLSKPCGKHALCFPQGGTFHSLHWRATGKVPKTVSRDFETLACIILSKKQRYLDNIMPKEKKIQRKTLSPKEWIPIIIAIIGMIGTIAAALISRLPPSIEKNQVPSLQTTESTLVLDNLSQQENTPVMFNNYDDPLGRFSLLIPSNMRLITSFRSESNDVVLFSTDNDIALNLSVMVGPASKPLSISDADNFNKLLVDNQDHDLFGEKRIVSNQKREKGFYLVYEVTDGPDNRYVCLLYEFENFVSVMVVLTTSKFKDTMPEGWIDKTVSSFKWLPSKVIENLDP